jgi:hypothetical protein
MGKRTRHLTATAGLAAAIAILALVAPAGGSPGSSLVLAPPSGGRIYHAAFPDFGGPEDRVRASRLHSFEHAAGRPLTWAYFSNNWFDRRIHFPAQDVQTVEDAGRVPFIRMMARSGFGGGRDPNYTMQSIIDGDWDEPAPGNGLVPWCQGAAASGVPLLVEFGTEVNGEWFPWNGRWNGGGKTDGYGDPSVPDGPERFRDAYRHIVDVCHAEGADNITWFFHVDVGPWPQAKWNTRFANYYPGDGYVDWIGVSDYGPLKPGQPWHSFRHRLDRVYDRFAALSPSKPIAVLEYGAADQPAHPGRKARWIRRAIGSVASGRWPRIAALSYWHERWRNGDGTTSDLHIDSSRRSRRAYRHAIDDPVFTSTPQFVPR